MVRKLLRTVAFILSVIVLVLACSGCDPYWTFRRESCKFSEMEYKRPDFDKMFKKLDELVDMIEHNKYSYNAMSSQLQKFISGYYYDFLTMSTLAFVKFVITPDSDELFEEYYSLSEVTGEFSAKMEDLFVACAQSKYCDNFEKDCFGAGQLEEYKDGAKYTDLSVELLSKEAQIVAEYKNLCADADTASEQYGELYAELVRTRISLARELGFGSYAEYAFSTLYRDYTPEDAFRYVDDVIEYLVPVYNERITSGLMWQGTNRGLSASELTETVGELMSEIGNYMSEPYEFMNKNELLYIANNEFAVTESFTTYFYNYNCPFVYISSTGTLDDIMLLVHEFGHFTDAYYNYNEDYILDLCEIASQALELLSLGYFENCETLSDEDVSYLKTYAYDTILSVFIQQSMFTRFEEKVYSLPYDEITAENINRIAAECLEEFGLTGILDSFRTNWYEITHFFNQAFYVTSYITSGDVALQIYGISLNDEEQGFSKYTDLFLYLDYEMNFIENVERAELESPFAEGRVQKIAALLSESFD